MSRRAPLLRAGTTQGRYRSLRWAVPVSVAAAVAVIAGGNAFHSHEPAGALPRLTPAALLAALGTPSAPQFSGTVVSHVDLGLPDLPEVDDLSESSPIGSLLSGSRTLQVWYGGMDKQRVALLGSTDETDLFRSGRTLWRWDSSDHVADHVQLAKDPATRSSGLTALTPAGMASSALDALRPTTRITVRADRNVADRAAYELVLRPNTRRTRVGAVHIAIDGRTKVPLGVQVYARGESSPAIDVSYTSISFAAPSPANFDFTPPTGSKVRHLTVRSLHRSDALSPGRLSLTGADWDGVLGYDTKRTVHLAGLGLGHAVSPVSGTWGRGRLLETSLLCVLLTNDGRVYAGAVDPSELYAAAERR